MCFKKGHLCLQNERIRVIVIVITNSRSVSKYGYDVIVAKRMNSGTEPTDCQQTAMKKRKAKTKRPTSVNRRWGFFFFRRSRDRADSSVLWRRRWRQLGCIGLRAASHCWMLNVSTVFATQFHMLPSPTFVPSHTYGHIFFSIIISRCGRRKVWKGDLCLRYTLGHLESKGRQGLVLTVGASTETTKWGDLCCGYP